MTIKNSACLLLLCSVLCLLSAQEPVINLAVPLTQDVIDKIPEEHVVQFAQFENQSVVQGMFEGRHPGTALTDADDQGRYTVLKSGGVYALLAGQPTQEDLYGIVGCHLLARWIQEDVPRS
jgi:hypothetical protein